MDTEVLVNVDLHGMPHLAGRLWARMRKGRDSATFDHEDQKGALALRTRTRARR